MHKQCDNDCPTLISFENIKGKEGEKTNKQERTNSRHPIDIRFTAVTLPCDIRMYAARPMSELQPANIYRPLIKSPRMSPPMPARPRFSPVLWTRDAATMRSASREKGRLCK